MAKLLFGVSGGIAAYKVLETARLCIAAGHAVRVIQTPAAQRFIGAASFQAITGAPVLTDEFEDDPLLGAYPGEPPAQRAPISHLALVSNADLYLIAPASANTIAKLAHGLADNLVTTAALGAGGVPLIVAPAMNDRMYGHPATRANLALLAGRGVTIVGPSAGPLASHGEHGVGRMAEPAALAQAVTACLAQVPDAPASPTKARRRGPWSGRRVLVSAGGTREPIDAVRYVGNRSSGRMGFALAARVAARGASVTVVAANVALADPPGVEVIRVETAAQLAAACEGRFAACDVLLMAAAVADFRPRDPAPDKLRKEHGPPRLEVEPTADVISVLAAQRAPGQLLVGFAAEHGADAVPSARAKLARKGLDAIVVNDVSQPGIGFDAVDNEVTVIVAGGAEHPLARASKERTADGVLDVVQTLLTHEDEESDHRTVGAGTARTRGD
ncbi:MAG: bifunctional phosphopantothenoylcysteine decarboxylase/phosphopantothenate--cysteine ligase CoaBC [Solirubrobacteraceae bacterium]